MPRPRVTRADAVLDAAARRLSSHGIAGTTVDDVAGEAGVSRATVYRYVGGKDEIVAAVIAREAEQVLARAAAVIVASTSTEQAVSGAVSTTLTAIAGNPLLSRLTASDLHETLPFITVHSRSLIERSVSSLSVPMRAAPGLVFDDEQLESALEEATRFVLAHLTTPRIDGSRMSPAAAGARAAALIAHTLSPHPVNA